ncbi:hypothetical protein B0H17DRAFT_341299 [Mycena rosella]|uniref:Uncharacterized protein n=1 Tax=Mycena rosella TaxID=1033263 RepID=A0AAD7DUH3_MYCRO|nr:hypothetical protein B0H17DRAFT_341299 [Mycena rosella]
MPTPASVLSSMNYICSINADPELSCSVLYRDFASASQKPQPVNDETSKWLTDTRPTQVKA